MSAVALLTLTTVACSHTAGNDFQAVNRTLPAEDTVIPKTTPRPAYVPGEDLGRRANRFADYGDSNATKLNQARANYRALQKTIAGPPAKKPLWQR